MYTEDDDSEHKIALTLVLGIAIFIIAGLFGFLGLNGAFSAKDIGADKTVATSNVDGLKNQAIHTNPQTTDTNSSQDKITASTAINIADLKADESTIIVDNGVVKFYFASGKADVAKGANEALTDVVRGIKSGQKASISGFHDITGDPAKNADLAKKRAISVRDALLALGAPEDKLELKKPEQTEGAGNNNEARRVEVLLIK